MTTRQLRILTILHEADHYMTADMLADQLQVSAKSVRNDITKLKWLLESQHLCAITSKPKMGYYLDVSEETWNMLMLQLEHRQKQELFSQDNMGKYPILEVLLKKGSTQLQQLEQEIYSSYKSISKYVDQAEQWLLERNIVLRRRRGSGISIDAERHWIRLAQWSLFSEVIQFEYRQPRSDAMIGKFLGLNTVHLISGIVDRVEEKYQLRFSYDSYQRLVFLMATIICDHRQRHDYRCPFPSVPVGQLGKKVSQDCIYWLQDAYHVVLADDELDFLSFLFGSTEIMELRNQELEVLYLADKHVIQQLAQKIIDSLGSILQIDFGQDAMLKRSLIYCLTAIYLNARYGNRDGLPLSKSIQDSHPNVYVACWAASHLLEQDFHIRVTEREIGAIATHICSAIERSHNVVNVYLMCDYGAGTARLLEAQLFRTFPNLNILEILTPREEKKILLKKAKYQMILTTVDLAISIPEPIVKISFPLDAMGMIQIQKALDRIPRMSAPASALLPSDSRSLLIPELVMFPVQCNTKEELIHSMCQRLMGLGAVSRIFEKSVLKREMDSSTTLNGGVAIPHGFPELVYRPMIAVALLDHPIKWTSKEEVDVVFLLALSMDAAFQSQKQIIRFYKGLVRLLDDPAQLDKFRKLRDANKVIEMIQSITELSTQDRGEG